MTKPCSTCDLEKDLNEYGSHRQKVDGKQSRCKACVNLANARSKKKHKTSVDSCNALYREQNREEINLRNKTRRANHHDQVLTVEAAYREANRGEIRDKATTWREANRTHLREYFALYRISNPDVIERAQTKRRAAEAGVISDGSTRLDVWLKSEGVCHLCETEWAYVGDWHVDHLIPLQPRTGSSGTDTLDNKAVSCPACNLRKSNKIVPSGAYV